MKLQRSSIIQTVFPNFSKISLWYLIAWLRFLTAALCALSSFFLRTESPRYVGTFLGVLEKNQDCCIACLSIRKCGRKVFFNSLSSRPNYDCYLLKASFDYSMKLSIFARVVSALSPQKTQTISLLQTGHVKPSAFPYLLVGDEPVRSRWRLPLSRTKVLIFSVEGGMCFFEQFSISTVVRFRVSWLSKIISDFP